LQISEYVEAGPRIVGGTQLIDGRVNWNECPCITKQRYDESPEIMLRQSDILMTKDGTIGKLAYVDEVKEPATVASGIFVIRSNSSAINQMCLLSYFKSYKFGKLVESRIEGSVVPHLYQRDIAGMLIVVPSAQIATKFELMLTVFQQRLDLNSKSSLVLEKTRNALLPKLMSGKIRVPVQKEIVEV
jgi:type I restriction enzyme S subunit